MNKIPVFFNSNMIVDIIFDTPSPKKPMEVVNDWLIKYQIEIIDFSPVSLQDFYLVHDKNHVDAIISLQKTNGMGTKHQQLADSLFWTSGSMLAAAKHALDHEVAVPPTSGFHHASYANSNGFCTFNGLLLTSQKLLDDKLVNQVGILDFDYHQGDGSQDIIQKLNLHQSIIHITGQTDYDRYLPNFFLQLPKLLERLKNVDVILYQAGADQHINDPFGGFLNNHQLRLRDKAVFEFAHHNKIPIAWNLAGGYQETIEDGKRNIQKVLDIHNGTMLECSNVYLIK